MWKSTENTTAVRVSAVEKNVEKKDGFPQTETGCKL